MFGNQQAIYQKHEYLVSVLEKHSADYLLLESQESYAWLTGGRGFIGLASSKACCAILLGTHGITLIANNIELERLKTEQVSEHPLFQYASFPWYEPQGKERVIQNIVTTKSVIFEQEVSNDLYKARTVLDDDEIARYEDICMDTAIELESACKGIYYGMSEYDLCGDLSKRFWQHNLEPITLLIGFDERAFLYRHPVPVGAILKNYALVAICTRRNGLIASVTRSVSLKRDERLLERQKITTALDAYLLSHTKPGVDLDDLFTGLQSRYAELGVPEEWQCHHQGGLTGYEARALKAGPGIHHIVRKNEAYAWNPTILGTKSENTILVGENDVQIFTHTGNYPYLKHECENKMYVSEDILVLED
jgi:hypothetical protein